MRAGGGNYRGKNLWFNSNNSTDDNKEKSSGSEIWKAMKNNINFFLCFESPFPSFFEFVSFFLWKQHTGTCDNKLYRTAKQKKGYSSALRQLNIWITVPDVLGIPITKEYDHLSIQLKFRMSRSNRSSHLWFGWRFVKHLSNDITEMKETFLFKISFSVSYFRIWSLKAALIKVCDSTSTKFGNYLKYSLILIIV